MRGPTPYEEYLMRLRDYYRIKGMERPSWVDAASEYYHMLFYSGRDLHEQCSNTNISKATMEWLSKLDQTLVSEDLPAELREGARNCVFALSEMYHTLTKGSDIYFVNQWTLSRAGRKKMREYLNALPSVSSIRPPKTEFNNVPLHNHYFCDLSLLTEDEANPYIKILKLVWDEYEDVLREKNLVLPWFKVLGWS